MWHPVGLTLLLSLWLYLALLSCTCLKLINHFGIIKYSKEEGIRKGQVKEFLKFSWHDSLFHICPPTLQPGCLSCFVFRALGVYVCVCVCFYWLGESLVSL